jgi:hypothetical protein
MGNAADPPKPSDHVTTARAALERAKSEWVNVAWHWRKTKNGWRARAAKVEIPEPTWPEDPTGLFLQTIGDRYVDDPQDEVIRRYLGEA